ncbi:MAG: hypothetical protein ACK4TG_03985 [Thermaurantiacus sp.]
MIEFVETYQLAILRWLHIVAMVYWLGGEWGVFQTSYKVVNPDLPLDERRRHMDTAYRIDILARTGIITLLPLGLHMGHLWGIQPWGGAFLWVVWILWAVLMFVTYRAFFARGTPAFRLWSGIEDWSRYILIPLLVGVGVTSLLGWGPFAAGTMQKWYSAKVLTFGLALVIGVVLRLVMHEWQKMFPVLAAGPNPAVEARLDASISRARGLAYLYWVLILTTAFLGAVKPF